jgi:hypothetical protein
LEDSYNTVQSNKSDVERRIAKTNVIFTQLNKAATGWGFKSTTDHKEIVSNLVNIVTSLDVYLKTYPNIL